MGRRHRPKVSNSVRDVFNDDMEEKMTIDAYIVLSYINKSFRKCLDRQGVVLEKNAKKQTALYLGCVKIFGSDALNGPSV
jgi:hypothetical protein